MEPDIKVGETYNVRVEVKEKDNLRAKVVTINPDGVNLVSHYFYLGETSAFSHINPYPPLNIPKMTEIPETYPKYDPRRLFRKGDKVRPVERYGRKPDDGAPVNVICEVVEDERKNGSVAILYRKNNISVRFTVTALYLELVTPVEELEPYTVEEGKASYLLKKGDKLLANYWPSHPNAKDAAEAERDRLNAECRKEQL